MRKIWQAKIAQIMSKKMGLYHKENSISRKAFNQGSMIPNLQLKNKKRKRSNRKLKNWKKSRNSRSFKSNS
jgi:hypothetical protein